MRAIASGAPTFSGDAADNLPSHNVGVYDDPVTRRTDSHRGTPGDSLTSAAIQVASTFNAVNDSFTATEDTQNNSFNPLANDTNIGSTTNTLTITATGTPDHGGTVSIAPDGKTISYTPSHNFFGTESFTYTATNQNNESNTATITVTVADVNDPPTAVADTLSVTRNSSSNPLNVLANDLIADAGETLRVTAVGTAGHGTVSISTSERMCCIRRRQEFQRSGFFHLYDQRPRQRRPDLSGDGDGEYQRPGGQ